MADNVSSTSINLLGTTSRVEVPVIGVRFGKYIFGVYNTVDSKGQDFYYINARFVKSLTVKKINGTVNTYTLRLDYPITSKDDPNLLDKVIASVSDTRTIFFSYGDASTPAFAYKQEEAFLTKVKRRTNTANAVKTYTISAVSKGYLNTLGSYKFPARYEKPSTVIKQLLKEPKYGLLSVFTGMKNTELVEQNHLIDDIDSPVKLEAKNNMSVLDYLKYLVDMMKVTDEKGTLKKKGIFLLTFEDGVNSKLGGTYFKVKFSSKIKNMPEAYEINIGYPSENVVTDFQIEDDETYAIYYKFAEELQTTEYAPRLDDNGKLIDVFAPAYASNVQTFTPTEQMKTWWTKVTEYPIKASITFKGLLRPAVLMSYVRLKIYWYGKPDIDSGLYVVQSQTDSIDENGFRTTLGLLRVGGDDTYAN